MKLLICNDQADAQALADACHQWLFDNNAKYQADCLNGWTTAWAIPSEIMDNTDPENPVGTGQWQIPVTADLSPVDPRIADLFPVEAWAL